MRGPLLATLFLVGARPIFGQENGKTPTSGYVVKVESGAVYLDLGEAAGAAVGRGFEVYTEGEELKHPVSGQPLGRQRTPVAQGRVTLVLPLYSVGGLMAGQPLGEVKTGMRARLSDLQPAAKTAEAPKPGGAREPRWKSPELDYAVTGMAVADFRGEGKPTVALSDKKTVSLYAYPPQQAQPLAQFIVPGVGPRILSLAAGDVNGNGRPELFVTLHNETFERVETLALEWTDGQWKQVADFPWMVRAFDDGQGRSTLAMQQLEEDQSFPFSTIYRLLWKDGRYAPGESVRFKRVDFLYDFTQAGLDGKTPALLYHTTTDRLRVQFKDGFWKTADAYGQTPTRLRWHSRLLEFHPQIPVGYASGKASVFLIKNDSALGSLSEPFGMFTGGHIEREAWNGLALTPEWRADLGGYCPAAQLVPGPLQPSDLAVAVTGTAGKSALWIFDP